MATKKTITTYTVNGKAGYADVKASRTAFSALTIASLVVTGLLQLSKTGAPTRGRRKYSKSALSAIVGSTTPKYWTTKSRLDDNGLTVDGLNEIQRRLTDPKYSYRTTRAAVDAFVTGLKSGGEIEVDGFKFHMSELAKKAKKVTPAADDGLGLVIGSGDGSSLETV